MAQGYSNDMFRARADASAAERPFQINFSIPKEGAVLALDCTGVSTARKAAVQCVKTWGTACYVGEGGDVTLDVSPDLLRRQVTLIGSWTFSAMGMLECARFIAEKKMDLERIFSHRWRLEQADEAYRSFDTQSTGKGVFLF